MALNWCAGVRLFAAIALVFAGMSSGIAQTTLRIFVGGQSRPDVMREIAQMYSSNNPTVKVEVELGGTMPDERQKYLNTALVSKDGALDLILIDVIRPAQLMAAQWAEPLDSYLGAEKDALMARYLPPYRASGIVNGKILALPFFADAQFLYFRKDLLEKYGLQPPKTWDELKLAAIKIMDGEKAPSLRGFETAGAPIEGTVCTYLVPFWGGGENFLKDGIPNLSGEAARKPFDLWADLKSAKITPPNLAEITTDRIRQDFQAGNLIFAMTWGYAWNRFDGDADSAVKGKVGVVPLPGFTADKPAACLGGWQVAVSSFSKNKVEAVKFARFLSSPEVSKMQAILASRLPVFEAVYSDTSVLTVNPWFAQALPAVLAAKSRPVSPRYSEVSDIIRSNMHAFLAGSRTADAALADMTARLGAIFK